MARLAVWARPGASRERIAGLHGGALKVAVTAPPEHGKANLAVERLLARELGLPAGAVRVTAGGGSRRKTVSVDGWSQDRLDAWLKGFGAARAARVPSGGNDRG